MEKENSEKTLETQLKDTYNQLELLEAAIAKARAEGKEEAKREIWYNQRMEELRTRSRVARDRISSLREKGPKAWKEIKFGVDHAVSDLKKAIKDARSSL